MSNHEAGVFLVCHGQNIVFQKGDIVIFNPRKRLLSISRQKELVCLPNGETEVFFDICEADFQNGIEILSRQFGLCVDECESDEDVIVACLQ